MHRHQRGAGVGHRSRRRANRRLVMLAGARLQPTITARDAAMTVRETVVKRIRCAGGIRVWTEGGPRLRHPHVPRALAALDAED